MLRNGTTNSHHGRHLHKGTLHGQHIALDKGNIWIFTLSCAADAIGPMVLVRTRCVWKYYVYLYGMRCGAVVCFRSNSRIYYIVTRAARPIDKVERRSRSSMIKMGKTNNNQNQSTQTNKQNNLIMYIVLYYWSSTTNSCYCSSGFQSYAEFNTNERLTDGLVKYFQRDWQRDK